MPSKEYPDEYPCNAGYIRKALRENGHCCAVLGPEDIAEILADELEPLEVTAVSAELQKRVAAQEKTETFDY